MRHTIQRYIENSPAPASDKQALLVLLEETDEGGLTAFFDRAKRLLGGVTKSYSGKRPTTWRTS